MDATPTPIPFPEFTDRFLRLYRRPLRARKTFLKMREVLASFAATPGVATTADLTTDLVALWITAQPARNRNTLRSRARCLKTASLFAHDEGWLARPPQWKRLMPRRSPAQAVRHFGFDQVATLLGNLEREATDWKGRRLYALASLVAYTGLRRNEALFLQLRDLSTDAGFLWVVPRGEGLKTEASAAAVPLPPPLVPVIEAWLPHAGPLWAFPGVRRKGPWHDGAPGYRPSDRLRRAAEAVGIEGLTFQALRHTLAKLIVGRFGGSADQARSMLRHTDARTTEEYYLHRDDAELLRRIAERISFRPGDEASST
jgi:integrase